MFYRPLRWTFRFSGVASKGAPVDRLFAVVALAAILASGLPMLLLAREFLNSVYGSLYYTAYTLSFASALIFLLYNCCFPTAYRTFERRLERAESRLSSIGAPPDRCLTMQVSMFCGLLFILAWLLAFNFILPHGTLMLVTRLFHQLLVVAPLLQHIVLARALGQGYSALNTRMREIAASVEAVPAPTTSAHMEAVFHAHSELQSITCDVNTHFCFFHIFNISSRTIFFVFQMYDYLIYISGFPERFSAYVVFFFLELLILFVLHAATCHAAAKEANRTVLIAHRMLTPLTPDRLWRDVGLFSSLSVDNKVRFTAGGVFNIDRTLLTRISVTALSYLVISIQLRDVALFGGATGDNSTTLLFNETTTALAVMLTFV